MDVMNRLNNIRTTVQVLGGLSTVVGGLRYFNTPVISPVVDQLGRHGMNLLDLAWRGVKTGGCMGTGALVLGALGYGMGYCIAHSEEFVQWEDLSTTKKVAAWACVVGGVLIGAGAGYALS